MKLFWNRQFHSKIKTTNDINENVRIFQTRTEMLSILPKDGVVVEVGVLAGDFSEELYTHLNPSKLILIDIFKGEVGSGDCNGNNLKIHNLDETFQILSDKYKNSEKVLLEKGYSYDILSKLQDNSIDVIYLDGDHSYDGVKVDLSLSFQKIKNGGWITGHDYDINPLKTDNRYDFGVGKAVDEFCINHKQRIFAKALDGCVSFAIKINK